MSQSRFPRRLRAIRVVGPKEKSAEKSATVGPVFLHVQHVNAAALGHRDDAVGGTTMNTAMTKINPERPKGKPWSVTESATFLGISTRSLWRLIDGGDVRVARIGRRVLLPDAEVRRLAGEGK